jgi:hypothetical protein
MHDVHCRPRVAPLSLLFCSHLNSTAFTLAKDSMHPDDSRMAQMVLALTAAVGCWIAHCLSFLWVVIPVP